jgi:hypothetical protein
MVLVSHPKISITASNGLLPKECSGLMAQIENAQVLKAIAQQNL